MAKHTLQSNNTEARNMQAILKGTLFYVIFEYLQTNARYFVNKVFSPLPCM